MAKEKRLFDTDSEEDEKEYKPTNKKQVAESSEDDEDFEEVEEKPKKAVKKQKEAATTSATGVDKRKREDVERNADGDQIFELSKKRRITVRAFPSGEAAIDIREVYQDKNGETRPGKGICLPAAQWNKLKELLPDIEEAVANLPAKKK